MRFNENGSPSEKRRWEQLDHLVRKGGYARKAKQPGQEHRPPPQRPKSAYLPDVLLALPKGRPSTAPSAGAKRAAPLQPRATRIQPLAEDRVVHRKPPLRPAWSTPLLDVARSQELRQWESQRRKVLESFAVQLAHSSKMIAPKSPAARERPSTAPLASHADWSQSILHCMGRARENRENSRDRHRGCYGCTARGKLRRKIAPGAALGLDLEVDFVPSPTSQNALGSLAKSCSSGIASSSSSPALRPFRPPNAVATEEDLPPSLPSGGIEVEPAAAAQASCGPKKGSPTEVDAEDEYILRLPAHYDEEFRQGHSPCASSSGSKEVQEINSLVLSSVVLRVQRFWRMLVARRRMPQYVRHWSQTAGVSAEGSDLRPCARLWLEVASDQASAPPLDCTTRQTSPPAVQVASRPSPTAHRPAGYRSDPSPMGHIQASPAALPSAPRPMEPATDDSAQAAAVQAAPPRMECTTQESAPAPLKPPALDQVARSTPHLADAGDEEDEEYDDDLVNELTVSEGRPEPDGLEDKEPEFEYDDDEEEFEKDATDSEEEEEESPRQMARPTTAHATSPAMSSAAPRTTPGFATSFSTPPATTPGFATSFATPPATPVRALPAVSARPESASRTPVARPESASRAPVVRPESASRAPVARPESATRARPPSASRGRDAPAASFAAPATKPFAVSPEPAKIVDKGPYRQEVKEDTIIENDDYEDDSYDEYFEDEEESPKATPVKPARKPDSQCTYSSVHEGSELQGDSVSSVHDSLILAIPVPPSSVAEVIPGKAAPKPASVASASSVPSSLPAKAESAPMCSPPLSLAESSLPEAVPVPAKECESDEYGSDVPDDDCESDSAFEADEIGPVSKAKRAQPGEDGSELGDVESDEFESEEPV